MLQREVGNKGDRRAISGHFAALLCTQVFDAGTKISPRTEQFLNRLKAFQMRVADPCTRERLNQRLSDSSADYRATTSYYEERPQLAAYTLLVINLLFFHAVGALKGNTDGDTKVIVAFTNPPTARYVRIFPRTLVGHQCMRAGLLIGQATEVVPYERLEYSSTRLNDTKGEGHGQGMLDSPSAWCSATNDLNQWIQMDAGQLKVIHGVVTQGRRTLEGTDWVTSYFIQASMDGVTWHAAEGYSTTCFDSEPWSWAGSSVVCGRFVALVLQDPPKFASVSTRNSAPVGSTHMPSYNASGGPQGNGHVTFEATKTQYLEMGVRTLQIASNGGLTIVAVVRFNSFGNLSEKVVCMGDGAQMDNILVGRVAASNSLAFEVSY